MVCPLFPAHARHFSPSFPSVWLSSFHHQTHLFAKTLGTHTFPHIGNDLFPQVAATPAPAPRTPQLFDASAQAAESQRWHSGGYRFSQLFSQFLSEMSKKEQLRPRPCLAGQPTQIRAWPYHTRHSTLCTRHSLESAKSFFHR